MAAIDNPDGLRERFCELLGMGMDVSSACNQAGVPKASLYRWLNDAGEAMDLDEKERTLYQRQALRWHQAYHQALGTYKEMILAHALRHSETDWRATEKLMKAHMGDLYGDEKVQLQVSGTVKTEHVLPDMTDVENMRKFWEARAEMGDATAKQLLAGLETE